MREEPVDEVLLAWWDEVGVGALQQVVAREETAEVTDLISSEGREERRRRGRDTVVSNRLTGAGVFA